MMAKRKKLISIITPCYNEGEGIDCFYEAILPIFDQTPNVDFEVVCVDDGSCDDTLEKLIALVGHDPRFRVIELSRNFGKEAALTAGIDAAKGDAVIPIDADLQDPPELIPVLIDEWQKGADVVLAHRANRSADSFFKRKTAGLFYRLHNCISSNKIPDNVGDFRLMDRLAVEAIKQLPERQRFMKGLFAWVGFRTTTVEYTRNPRLAGATKFSSWKLWNFALEGITSFSAVPLKVWTYVGGIGVLLIFFYSVIILFKIMVYGSDISGYISILLAIMFFGCLQLIGIGLLGEYLGRIYMEAKQRPIYIVRKNYEVNDKPSSCLEVVDTEDGR
jgi:glycosyltransferase involved in cell wall biosynthesis